MLTPNRQSLTAPDSWLFRLDPRVKLWFALLGMAVSILAPQHAVLLAALAACHLILLLGGVSARQIGLAWRSLALIVALILVAQPILLPGPGPALAQIGPIRITEAGLLAGLRYALRVSAATFAALVAVLTTPTHVLVRGMEKLGLPYSLGLTVGLALHYFGAVGDLYRAISEAQQARGWDLSRGGTLKRARAAVPTLIATIIASLRLSDSLALGLAARGFGMNRPRTYRRDIAMTRADWLVLLASTLLYAGVIGFLLYKGGVGG
jgi:energy-coupling factor transport system permease protein